MIIPQAVAIEILNGPDDDPAKHWIATTGQQWIQDTGAILPLVAGWDLGAGESAVLSWCYEHPAYEAVLDDLAARKFAKSFGIALCGTVGVIVIAKRRGVIPSIKPLLTNLMDAGFRIDSRLCTTALHLAGESTTS
jgi:predicted nucleic acid-binding protein